MKLRELLECVPPLTFNEACARLWKNKGEYYPEDAVWAMRKELVNADKKENVPYMFLSCLHKESGVDCNGATRIKTSIDVSVISVQEIRKMCKRHGTKEVLKNCSKNIEELKNLLLRKQIPAGYNKPGFEENILFSHPLYNVRWDMLSDMEVAVSKDLTYRMEKTVAAILYKISKLGFSKRSYSIEAQKEKALFASPVQDEKDEEELSFLPDFAEEELEEEDFQAECRIQLFNLKEYTEALGEAVAYVGHIKDWQKIK